MVLLVLFGGALISTSVTYMRKPDPKRHQLLASLSLLTLAGGLLGTVMGMVSTLHVVHEFDDKEQLTLIATGVAESLHNLVLALLVLVLVAILTSVGALRLARQTQTTV